MAILEMQRNRDHPESGYRSSPSGEDLLWDEGKLQNIALPSSIAAGQSITVSGTLKFDYNFVAGLAFPRPARVTVRGGGDSVTQELGPMDAKETRQFSVSLDPNVQPGQSLNVEVIGEGNDIFRGWMQVAKQIQSVDVQTEQQQQVDDAFSYTPWLIGGGGIGAAYSSYSSNEIRTGPVAAGAAGGVFLRQYKDRVGLPIPDAPNVPTRELLVIGGVLAAGGYLLSQGGNYIPGVE